MSLTYHEMEDKVLEMEAKLLEIENLVNGLAGLDLKSMNEEEIEKATTSLVRYEMAIRSVLRLAKRMGLPDEVQQAIITFQHIQRVVRLLELSYHALQVARLASGDPIAWIQFGIYVGTAAATIADTV